MDHYTETEALNKLQATLREHDLRGWTARLDNAKTRGGICYHHNHTISLSRLHITTGSRDDVDQTIIHEVAHALVGPGHGHDAVWASKARTIGYRGSRTMTVESSALMQAAAPWVATCPNGHISGRKHRKPSGKKLQSCGKCSRTFNPAYLISWARVEVAPVKVEPVEPAWMASARERGRKVIAENLANRS